VHFPSRSSRLSNKWSPQLYEGQHSFVWKYGADLLPLLNPLQGERILDLGCGTGHLTAQIAESGATVTGIDKSPEMIGQARQNFPNIRFMLSDATAFELAEPVDAVFSNAVLHWVTDAESAVRAVARALRPGGRFVAEFGGKRNVTRLLQGVTAAAAESGFKPRNPWYFPSLGEYASLLERNGFEVGYGMHFDRFTPLEEGESSLAEWLDMFGTPLLADAPAAERRSIVQRVEELVRDDLHRDGRWHVDYVRLRVVAVRQA
jgi:trans-aconitate methyltransferase